MRKLLGKAPHWKLLWDRKLSLFAIAAKMTNTIAMVTNTAVPSHADAPMLTVWFGRQMSRLGSGWVALLRVCQGD